MVSTRNLAPYPRKRGFTLIELMVATAIMTLLVLAVMGVTSHVLSTWSSASGRLGANAEARSALQYLGDDLETLVVRPKRQVWLEVDYDNVDVGGKTTRFPNISLVTATEHRLRSDTDYGNICAVNYQLAFRHPLVDGAELLPAPVAGLYRKVMSPSNTFSQVLTPQVPQGGGEPVDLASLKSIVEDGDEVVSFANFLNSNIVDLTVEFFAENIGTSSATVPVLPIPANTPFIYADKIYNPVTKQPLNNDFGRLVYADIRMTVLSDEGSKLLAAAGAGLGGRSAEDIISQYGTVFSRRVPILSRY